MLKAKLKLHTEGLLYSYAQVFFARSKWYGALLLAVSFVDPAIGLCGLAVVLLTNLLAEVFSLSSFSIGEGIFGFSAAMLGMGLGATFKCNSFLAVLLIVSALLILLTTKFFKGLLEKYRLPFMSLPFLFSFWLLLLATRFFGSMEYRDATSFQLPQWIASLNTAIENAGVPDILLTFFRSLAAVFFQGNVITGVVIAIGLLLYSRITFSLALLGLSAAYVFYHFAGINTNELSKVLVGSNYFFTAFAVGGFFVVPNFWSYLSVVLLVPVVAVVHYSASYVLGLFLLPVYTTGFTISTILFLYLLNWRQAPKYLIQVVTQFCQPEANLRHYLTTRQNYRNSSYYPVSLPFWGEWMVSQAHDGKVTHLGNWSKAFDFIILDEELKSFQLPAKELSDFYCYDKPVLAPGDGYVVKIEDAVEENAVGDVNVQQNWGNSIVIHHAGGLYSQVSHLKRDSLKVKEGDYVYRGAILASCGNSGRSPEPHIHFQLQLSPTIGAPTYDYPIASYILQNGNQYKLKLFDRPKEGELIRAAEINPILQNAFYFIPGTKLNWTWKGKTENWEVFTDAWNRSYFYHAETQSSAWFANDGVLFRFLDFKGNQNTFLYQFYRACFTVFLGYYQDLELEETFPVPVSVNRVVDFFTDAIVPFYQPVKAHYTLKYNSNNSLNNTGSITLASTVQSKAFGTTIKESKAELQMDEKGLTNITVLINNKREVATCVRG